MKITKGESATFVVGDWDTQISVDPLFNKKMVLDKKKSQEVVNDNILGTVDMDLGGFLDGCEDCKEDK